MAVDREQSILDHRDCIERELEDIQEVIDKAISAESTFLAGLEILKEKIDRCFECVKKGVDGIAHCIRRKTESEGE